MVKLRIAGKLIYVDMPRHFLDKNFEIFECEDSSTADFNWKVTANDDEDSLGITYIKNYKGEDSGMFFAENDSVIKYEFYEKDVVPSKIICEKDFTKASFIIDNQYAYLFDSSCVTDKNDQDKLDLIKLSISNTFREIFFLGVAKMGILMMHSASVIDDDKAYIFSAPSGVGKSTHSNMWIEQFDCRTLDGDVCALAVEENELVAYGLPWCGTSGLFVNECHKVGAICFLSQSDENEIRLLSEQKTGYCMFMNQFTPTLTEGILDAVICNALSFGKRVKAYALCCLPDKAAAKLSYRFMTGKNVRLRK